MTIAPPELPRSDFIVPAELSAGEPPEARGLERDEVRLLVAGRDGLQHARFDELERFLSPGDLLVVNTSATVAAAVDGSRNNQPVTVHFSAPLDDGTWSIELRVPDRSGPIGDAVAGEVVQIPDGRIELLEGYPDSSSNSRLWRARVDTDVPVDAYLARHGRPISYRYIKGEWPLSYYQTVFAHDPGSAEMPSAARPFSDHLVTRLVSRGITFAPITLHCGVSSMEAGELPLPERFEVPISTARAVNRTVVSRGSIIAVGTTVTRALETVAEPDGLVKPGRGWTDLVVGQGEPVRVVNGLITGWHEPHASHLLLLEAVAGADRVQRAYDEAIANGYLWHEFGDSCFFLP
jgi:S-adenosylmethionine:tRNA ribosyltransferase-isomerase